MGGSRKLNDTKKYAEGRQLRIEDYLQEVGVEIRGNTGVQSISSMSEWTETVEMSMPADCLKKSLTLAMNRPFKRVKPSTSMNQRMAALKEATAGWGDSFGLAEGN